MTGMLSRLLQPVFCFSGGRRLGAGSAAYRATVHAGQVQLGGCTGSGERRIIRGLIGLGGGSDEWLLCRLVVLCEYREVSDGGGRCALWTVP